MKRFLGIIMLVMVLMMGAASAKEVANISRDDAYELVNEWGICQGYEKYVNLETNGDIFFGTGAIGVEEFYIDSGLEWSIDNWRSWSIDNWHMINLDVKKVGEIEGYDVFLTNAETSRESGKYLQSKWNEKTQECEYYYKVSILFMVYSEN